MPALTSAVFVGKPSCEEEEPYGSGRAAVRRRAHDRGAIS
jgi:hypothetical protein